MRTTTNKLGLITLAVAAAATLAIPVGASARHVTVQTTNVCSYHVKPASCYLTRAQAAAASLSLAEAILPHGQMTAGEFRDWTQGVCSYKDKPASCYLTPAQARLASLWLAESMGIRTATQRGA